MIHVPPEGHFSRGEMLRRGVQGGQVVRLNVENVLALVEASSV